MSYEKRDWVNKEIASRTEGKTLSRRDLKKIYKQVWKEAKRKFDR